MQAESQSVGFWAYKFTRESLKFVHGTSAFILSIAVAKSRSVHGGKVEEDW